MNNLLKKNLLKEILLVDFQNIAHITHTASSSDC